MEPAFADFNFCSIWDPALKMRLPKHRLFRLAYQARQGHRGARMELSDTIDCTLRPAAFEAFQQAHGPFAATHAEWLYSKLRQIFDVLLYERLVILDETTSQKGFRDIEEPWNEGLEDCCLDLGPHLTEEDVQEYLVPEDIERVSWSELVDAVSRARLENRPATLRQWLSRQREARISASKGARGSWGRNRERNQTISDLLGRQIGRERICAELDRQRIALNLPALEARGFPTCAAAWADPEGREAIQRLFSKLTARRNAVKSLIVSE